jgi:hypothetical protein
MAAQLDPLFAMNLMEQLDRLPRGTPREGFGFEFDFANLRPHRPLKSDLG